METVTREQVEQEFRSAWEKVALGDYTLDDDVTSFVFFASREDGVQAFVPTSLPIRAIEKDPTVWALIGADIHEVIGRVREQHPRRVVE